MASETLQLNERSIEDEIHSLSIAELGTALRDRRLTSVAITEYFLDRIRKTNPHLNAFVTVSDELALEQAETADKELARGIDRGHLHGIPMAVKDNIDTAGLRTTRGSCLFADHMPSKNAAIVELLFDSGAVLLGKTAMHEFAYGMSGINPHFGPTRNPWDLSRDAGGSSSGSAVAVAAGLCAFAIGTDTGGSVRQPAHTCGVVGFKTTFGAMDMRGVFPLAPSMDHLGFLAKTVEDNRIAFKTLRMRNQVLSERRTSPLNHNDPLNLRLGVDGKSFFQPGAEVSERIIAAVEALTAQGATQVDIEVQQFDEALKDTRTTFREANEKLLPLFDSNPSAIGEDVAAKIRAARELTATQYEVAQKARQTFLKHINQQFEKADVLVLPTSNVAAALIADRPSDYAHQAWRNCGIFNFTGHPAVSLPVGLLSRGLPCGLMLVAPHGADIQLLSYAELVRGALAKTGFSFVRPPLVSTMQ